MACYTTTCCPEPVLPQITIFNSYSYQVGHYYEVPSAATAPAGAIDCIGQTLSRAVYPELLAYAVDNNLIGPGLPFGDGDGVTTFVNLDISPSDSQSKYVVQYTTASATTISDRKVIAFTLPGAGASGDIVLQVQDSAAVDKAGTFNLRLWFVEDPAVLNPPTPIPFTTPGVSEWFGITESDGSYTLPVVETGSWKVLYLCAEIGGEIFVSSAITLGNA